MEGCFRVVSELIRAAGSVINGASIPRLFWSVIGGPFEGRFRNASVLHDSACELQTNSWQNAHRMFYNAMRCSRVGSGKAQTMYRAVYHSGPRWTVGDNSIVELHDAPPAEIVANAERYFNKRDFTAQEIEDCTAAAVPLLW